MDFERRYPHPKLKYEYFVAHWTKGYRSAELWYNNRLVISVSGTEQLLKGVKFYDEIVGDIEFKLEQDPYVLNVKVDGYRSRINSKHPDKGIKSVSNWILPGILYYFLATIVYATVLFGSYYPAFVQAPLYFNLIGLGLLITTYILIRFVSPVFFFMGLLVYVLQLTLFTLSVLQSSSINIFGVILYLGFLAFVGAMVLPVRRLISYIRHRKFDFYSDSGVLDN